jgi:hypothetical protein
MSEIQDPGFFDVLSREPGMFVWMIVVGLVGVACFGGGVALLVKKRPTPGAILGGVALLLGLLALGSGGVSYVFSTHNASFAAGVEGLSTADQQRLVSLATAKASYSLFTGIGAGLLPLLGGAGVLAIGLLRRRRSTSPV